MAKRGRPKIVIDWEMVEKLASIQCTIKEISDFIQVKESTLKSRPEFSSLYKKARQGGKCSLRRKQWLLADNSAAMAIFLGKQYLGQRDQIEDKSEPTATASTTWHSIRDVAEVVFNDYQFTELHSFLSYKLESFIAAHRAGRAPRLHISLPPQHGKTWAVRLCLALILSQHPELHVAWTTYSAGFAASSGKVIRDWLTEYQPHLFPAKKPKLTEKEWKTETGGGLFSTGTGGPLTGQTVDLLVADDMLKNYDEYLSEAHKRKVKDWVSSVVGTRLNNLSSVLSIGTRWGVGDAIDMLIETIPGDWEIIAIPALAGEGDILNRKPGEALWETMHSAERLEQIRDRIGPLKWAALYQQAPLDDAGKFFLRDRWQFTDAAPDATRLTPWCRYWDLGFVEGGHGSACALVAIDVKTLDIYVKDVRYIDAGSVEIEDMIIRQAREDGKGVKLGIEANGPQVHMANKVSKALSGFHVFPRTSKIDKKADAGLWRSEQWGAKVFLHSFDYRERYIDRAHEFPGKDIDEIDATSGAIWLARTFISNNSGAYQL